MTIRISSTTAVAAVIGLVFVCATSAPVAGRAADPLQSRWRGDDMKVDGSPVDWPAMAPLAKGLDTGVANDADTLQLIVATSDPAIRERLALAGLVVYVDPTNKKAETFGIRIPPLGRLGPGESRPDPHVTYVEMMGAAKDDRHVLQFPTTTGIEAAASMYEGTLEIEVALPMRRDHDHPYAPDVAADKSAIEIGLVTPDPPVSRGGASPRGGSGGGRGGYGGGRGGGGGGRGGAGGGGYGESTGKALKIWTPIVLARSR